MTERDMPDGGVSGSTWESCLSRLPLSSWAGRWRRRIGPGRVGPVFGFCRWRSWAAARTPRLWGFEVGQARPAVLDQLRLGGLCAWFELDVGQRGLAPFLGPGWATTPAMATAGWRQSTSSDLDRGDVRPAGGDHVLGPVF